MFKKNDEVLLTAKTLINVFTVILAIIWVIVGITLALLVYWAYFLLIFAGWLVCWVTWIFARLILSHICDVKLIRNILYGENNDGLEAFLSGDLNAFIKSREKYVDEE